MNQATRTIKLPIALSEEDQEFIMDLQRQQSSVIRSAYNLAFEKDQKEKQLRTTLSPVFPKMDSWFVQSAIIEGVGMASVDKKQGARKRIFGGKKAFIGRTKGDITKEEWKAARLLPLNLYGEALQKGNRKFEFFVDKVVFKPRRGKKVEIPLIINLKKNWQRKLQRAFELANEKKLSINIKLTKDWISFTFDYNAVEKSKEKKVIKNRFAGIDLNPNYVGVSVFDSSKLIDYKLFSLKELTGKNKNENKIRFETIEIAHAVKRFLKGLQVDKVFIEELSMKSDDRKKGRTFNRLCNNQWKRQDFTNTLSKFYKLHSVNAAYSSTIGNVLYTNLPDPVAASAEIAQRGYRLVIAKNKKFYPDIPNAQYLEDLWKETEGKTFGDWKELHSWIKESKVKYRVSLPNEEFFRKFQSTSSGVKYFSPAFI